MNETERILLIENNPDHAFLIKESLETAGYQVYEAEDGESGIELLQKSSFQLILLDHGLTGLSGIDVLRRIKEMEIDTPVVMLTGFGIEELVREAIDEGAYDFIVKSFEPGFFGILPLYIKNHIAY